MITADINTKQVYNNQTVKVIEIREDGDIAFMGKTIDKKYLEWTKYPAYVGKQLVPKTIDLVLDIFRKNKKLLNYKPVRKFPYGFNFKSFLLLNIESAIAYAYKHS